jgi:hypothetical protein
MDLRPAVFIFPELHDYQSCGCERKFAANFFLKPRHLPNSRTHRTPNTDVPMSFASLVSLVSEILCLGVLRYTTLIFKIRTFLFPGNKNFPGAHVKSPPVL